MKPTTIETNKAKNLILNRIAQADAVSLFSLTQLEILQILRKEFPKLGDAVFINWIHELNSADYINSQYKSFNRPYFPSDHNTLSLAIKGANFIQGDKFPETRAALFKIWIAKPDHWLAILGLLIGTLTLIFSYLAYINPGSTSQQPPSSTQPLQEVSPSDPASISPPSIDADSSEQQPAISPADSLHPSDTIVSQMPAEYP